MSEIKIQFTGWQTVIVIVILIGVIAGRFIGLADMSGDEGLMKKLDTLLLDEYSPYVVEKMRSAVDSGDGNELAQSVKSVANTKVHIISVQASYPVFDFSTPKKVVVKVVFSLDNSQFEGEKRTIYYLFEHGLFGWHYQYITSSWKYYLNFM